MIEWIIKKVVVGKVNSLLKDNKDNIDKVREVLKVWVSRIKKILDCLESAITKLDDNEISAEELKSTSDEITAVIKEW